MGNAENSTEPTLGRDLAADHRPSSTSSNANSQPDAAGSRKHLTEKNGEAATVEPPETPKAAVLDDKAGGRVSPPTSVHAPNTENDIEKPIPEENADEENTTHYLSGTKLYLLTLGLCLATFVVALDNSIIATAIPKITTDFESFPDAAWYGSAYLLTTTALQPTFGKVYAYFNVKWTYISALIIFEVGSIICAAAPNSEALIVGRAVAGAGASALFSGGMTIIAFSVALHRRAIYIAALSSMFGISSVVGPILGGAFTDRLTWRWCFWINLPIGGVAIVTVFLFFSNPVRDYNNMTTKQKLKEIDSVGAVFLMGAIVSLLLALQWGGTTYPWTHSRVWGCFLSFGLLVIVFSLVQWRRGERATLPPRIVIHQRTVLASVLFSALLAMAIYSHIFYLPYYFQSVKGTTAEESGIRCIPYLIAVTVGSLIVGGAVTMIGYYSPFTWIGSAIFTVGAGLLYTLKVNSPSSVWIGYQVLAGFGAGACIQIPFLAVQAVLSEKDMPVGNALPVFSNSLGGAISIAITQNIFATRITDGLAGFPGVDARLLVAAGATRLRALVPPDLLPPVLEIYVRGITTAFILPIVVGGLSFLVSTLFEWKSLKGKKVVMGGA